METPIEWLPAQGAPEQLIVLLHGWGGRAVAMLPLAQALRAAFPQAALLAPDAPHAHDEGGRGRQWYSIRDLGPANWPARVAAVLTTLEPWVREQQRRLGVGPAATALGGFSQGAILALALAAQSDGIAGRVLAFGGRYVALPDAAPRHTTVHLFHGGADAVIPPSGSREAFEHLAALQGDATLDIADGVGHVLHAALIDCALQRLRSHIPLRTWQAALGAASRG
ncbi:MAG: esterase [Burkholderiales bacterium]|nr:esterase [Burkholderiales bacterium]